LVWEKSYMDSHWPGFHLPVVPDAEVSHNNNLITSDLFLKLIFHLKGIVNSFLSIKLLQPIARLSYGIYLLRLPTIFHKIFSIRYTYIMTDFETVSSFDLYVKRNSLNSQYNIYLTSIIISNFI
jgi:hypothetical protein